MPLVTRHDSWRRRCLWKMIFNRRNSKFFRKQIHKIFKIRYDPEKQIFDHFVYFEQFSEIVHQFEFIHLVFMLKIISEQRKWKFYAIKFVQEMSFYWFKFNKFGTIETWGVENRNFNPYLYQNCYKRKALSINLVPKISVFTVNFLWKLLKF